MWSTSLRVGRKGTTEHVTGDNISFIYYDMRTAFLGRFENKLMLDAREEGVHVLHLLLYNLE